MKINQNLKDKYPWKMKWTARTELIAKIIPSLVGVLDLGGGMCELEQQLENCFYTSIDNENWTDHTIKADFNKNQFPIIRQPNGQPHKYHFIVCAGILEYMKEPKYFLEKIKQYGEKLILTYRFDSQDTEHERNMMDEETLITLIRESGWQIVFNRPITIKDQETEKHKLYYCSL